MDELAYRLHSGIPPPQLAESFLDPVVTAINIEDMPMFALNNFSHWLQSCYLQGLDLGDDPWTQLEAKVN
ncbi:hypothetical protein P171DRAFT_523723 [Karstenula rhodostoma CBS 690.94]|uniref:Uncharacterized protein n=1 Tax=Karstenula rhodostoma CBS 690.94 TaxID=1392251 RepID=A0A9P4PEY1_9PLEO|nr:hypothetical protein P171DRAFT_523723 [Karstenula rhodostoma CBS 690.94]